jgi:DNA-binding protein H-NS
MGLKETTNQIKRILDEIAHDLVKASEGNKTAAQRVRTNSIKFAKVAKVYRKESIAAEKGTKGRVKKAPAKKVAAKKAPAKKAAKKSSSKKSR